VHTKEIKSTTTAYVSIYPLITHQTQLTLQKITTKNDLNKKESQLQRYNTAKFEELQRNSR
jgi:hypothetical protein